MDHSFNTWEGWHHGLAAGRSMRLLLIFSLQRVVSPSEKVWDYWKIQFHFVFRFLNIFDTKFPSRKFKLIAIKKSQLSLKKRAKFMAISLKIAPAHKLKVVRALRHFKLFFRFQIVKIYEDQPFIVIVTMI